MNARELIAEATQKTGASSAYAMARSVGIPEQNITRWNTGKHVPDDASTVLLANAAGIDAGVALASMQAIKARTPEARQQWERMAARLVTAATTATLAAVNALPALGIIDPLCIMSTRKRGLGMSHAPALA